MGICGSVFEDLKFGLSEKKATVKHKCSKCGNIDEEQVTVERDGLNFSGPPQSGLSNLCIWSKKQ